MLRDNGMDLQRYIQPKQQGYILVMTLLVLAIITVLTMLTLERTLLTVKIADNFTTVRKQHAR